MTWNDIVNIFKDIANNHPQIKRFESGEMSDSATDMSNSTLYPLMWLVPQTVSLNEYDTEFVVRLLMMEIDDIDDSKQQIILSNCLSIINDVIKTFKYILPDSVNINDGSTVTPFSHRFVDYCTGWFVDLTIIVGAENSPCNIPIDGVIYTPGSYLNPNEEETISAINGLSIYNNEIGLGGTMSFDTTIISNNFNLIFDGFSSGLLYADDYSANFLTHSLVDKKYVDDEIGGLADVDGQSIILNQSNQIELSPSVAGNGLTYSNKIMSVLVDNTTIQINTNNELTVLTVTGPAGPTGATGADSTVPGPQGPIGATGPNVVSSDINNQSLLGSDGYIWTGSFNTTGISVGFTNSQIYNSPSSPGTSSITEDLSGAKIGIVQKIYHQWTTAPSIPVNWTKLGSGNYATSSLNRIYVEWVGGTASEYWIV